MIGTCPGATASKAVGSIVYTAADGTTIAATPTAAKPAASPTVDSPVTSPGATDAFSGALPTAAVGPVGAAALVASALLSLALLR